MFRPPEHFHVIQKFSLPFYLAEQMSSTSLTKSIGYGREGVPNKRLKVSIAPSLVIKYYANAFLCLFRKGLVYLLFNLLLFIRIQVVSLKKISLTVVNREKGPSISCCNLNIKSRHRIYRYKSRSYINRGAAFIRHVRVLFPVSQQ